MTIFWKYKVYAELRILVGVLLAGASNENGVVDDGNFWRFEWLLLWKLQR